MPSTVVHAAFAFLLAIGLLGIYYDRRALGIILVIIVIPELDTVLGFVMDGAHRTVGHTMMTSVVAGGFLYWDTTRESSWIRRNWGAYGVRVAWVALFAHTFAHLALDWAHLDGINFFWPLVDQFFNLDGEIYLSADGFTQTFIDLSTDPETGRLQIFAGQGGTTGEIHVSSPVQPTQEPTESVDRRFPIAVRGWQLYVVVTSAFALAAKKLQTDRDE